ncbi:MAG: metal-dependent hydrolase [Bacteroidota bacterium]
MDSLTQIVLGAAMGEVVAGKKAGNRALVWGAVGGTIPDLDILANLVTDEITALAFHRGISHSIFFAIVAPWAFGWIVHRLYDSGFYQKKGYRIGLSVAWLAFLVFLFVGIPMANGSFSWLSTLLGIGLAGGIGWWLSRTYWQKELKTINVPYQIWVSLFFWSIFTHPLLDSCTAYGTQLFQPFWDYRVAFNNISVVDPIYTIPFLICIILVSRFTKDHRWRNIINWIGIGLSTGYLLFTFYNKYQVDQVFTNAWGNRGIEYHRHMTAPTIFNNILWQGIAEGDTAYYHGVYSLWDDEPIIDTINILPKNHEWLGGHEKDPEIKTLLWFSGGYYNIIEKEDGSWQFNDLRYGSFNGVFTKPEDYIFRFNILQDGEEWKATQRGVEPEFEEDALPKFWRRIRGIRD